MTKNVEELSWQLPDKVVHPQYLNPKFWLSGAYEAFETDTVWFVPIGQKTTRWLYELNDRNSLNFAALMAAVTAVGKPEVDIHHVRSGMPSNIFFLKGTVQWAIELPSHNPKHLSIAAREEMSTFAKKYPHLLDVLRIDARTDFQNSYDNELFAPAELRMYHGKMPGKLFCYWHACFPDLIKDLYQEIHVNTDGVVTSYKVQPVSVDLADYLGITSDPFEGMAS